MRKKTLILIFLPAVILLSAIPVKAGFDYQLDFTSRYIWRGFDLNPANKPAIQPSITYGFGDSGFAVNLWGSFSFENKQVNETDITLSYDFKLNDRISMSVGFIHYGWYFTENFDFGDHTTQELYVTASLPGGFVDTSLTLYYDISNGSGLYLLLQGNKSVQVSEKMNLDLSASIGYNGKQWIAKSGFSDLVLGAALPLKLEKVTVTPFANLAFILLDEVNPSDTELWFGVSVSF